MSSEARFYSLNSTGYGKTIIAQELVPDRDPWRPFQGSARRLVLKARADLPNAPLRRFSVER